MKYYRNEKSAFALLEALIASALTVILMLSSVSVITNIQSRSLEFRKRVDSNTNWLLAVRHMSQQVHASSYMEIPGAPKGDKTLELYDYSGNLKGTYTNTDDGMTYSKDNVTFTTFTNVHATFKFEPSRKKYGKNIIVKIQFTIPRTDFIFSTDTISTLYLKSGIGLKTSNGWAATYYNASDAYFGVASVDLRAGVALGGGIIRSTSDGGYIYVNSIYISGYYTYILKMTGDGAHVWSKLYGPNAWGNDVQETSDGGYIIAGTRYSGTTSAMLLKLDKFGSIVSGWPKAPADGITGFTSTGADFVILTDDGYLVAGRGETSSYAVGVVMEIDSSGNRIGYYIADNPVSETDRQNRILSITGARASLGGAISGYIVTGCSLSSSFIIRLNTGLSSTSVWENRTTANFICENDVKQIFDNSDNDDGYIVAGWSGGMCLTRLGPDGIELWKKTYPVQSGTNESADTVQIIPGGYIISGHTLSSYNYYIFKGHLIKTDTSGNPVWSKDFNAGSVFGTHCNAFAIPYHVECANDGGYLLAGLENVFGDQGSAFKPNVYLIRTDSKGKCSDDNDPDKYRNIPVLL